MEIAEQINQALEFVKQQDYSSAQKIYLTLLKTQPNNSVILSFLGYLYLTVKEPDNAERVFEKAYSIAQTETILSGLALAKCSLKKYTDAASLYIELIKLKPNYENYVKLTDILAVLTSTLNNKYAFDLYKYCSEALEKFPLSKEIALNISVACLYSGKFSESEKYLSDCLKYDTKFAKAWLHAGFIQECLYCNEDMAQEYYKKAIKYGVGYSGYYDLGVSYSKSGDYKRADYSLKKALELLPDNETIILAIACNYFRQRKFKKGYEYYLKQNDSSFAGDLKKEWDGQIHKEKSIFVYPDLAFGDHIMFMRYVPFLKDRFKSVKVFVYPNLKKLFEKNFDVEFVEEIPDYDYSVALSKLPYYLDMDFKNIPYQDKYIDAEGVDIQSDKLKVGLCWEAGNCDLRSTIHRSININEFVKLFGKGFDIYSFQVNPSDENYKNFSMTDLGRNFRDFYDTAAYLKAMDVVVTVDTSVANLAGAMGIKTFMLLPYYADWRWFDNDKTTEWYSSITIVKQSCKNMWASEITRIIDELTKIKRK